MPQGSLHNYCKLEVNSHQAPAVMTLAGQPFKIEDLHLDEPYLGLGLARLYEINHD